MVTFQDITITVRPTEFRVDAPWAGITLSATTTPRTPTQTQLSDEPASEPTPEPEPASAEPVASEDPTTTVREHLRRKPGRPRKEEAAPTPEPEPAPKPTLSDFERGQAMALAAIEHNAHNLLFNAVAGARLTDLERGFFMTVVAHVTAAPWATPARAPCH